MISFSAVTCLSVAFRTHLMPAIIRDYCIGLGIILLIPGRFEKISLTPKPNWWQITTAVLFSIVFFFSFRSNWIAFYKFEHLIEKYGK